MVGSVQSDPEFRVTANGVPTLTFRLSVPRPARQDGQASYPDVFRVVLWRMAAEKAREQLHKGATVVAEGRLRAVKIEREGQRKNFIELEASRLDVIQGAGSVSGAAASKMASGDDDPFGDYPMDDDYQAPNAAPAMPAPGNRRAAAAAAAPVAELDDDDIPF